MSEGHQVRGRWSLSDDVVTLEIDVTGRRLALDLTASPSHDRLTQASGAFYQRVDRVPD